MQSHVPTVADLTEKILLDIRKTAKKYASGTFFNYEISDVPEEIDSKHLLVSVVHGFKYNRSTLPKLVSFTADSNTIRLVV